VELRDVSVAGAVVSIRFQRSAGGAIEGEVIERKGTVGIVFEA
jgi:hypothetical protein